MDVFAICILIFSFILLIGIGTPIAWSIALSSLFSLIVNLPNISSFTTVAQRMATGLDSFSLLAIPFFILSGQLMTHGGIAKRLISFAKTLVVNIPGGLALINIVSAMMMGAITGSAMASASAMGSTLGPEMENEGYEKEFSAAINITSATMGLVIPPSNILIIYSLASGGISIAALFLAGYLPGIIIGLFLMIVAAIWAKRKGYPVLKRSNFRNIISSFINALPSILLLFIVIGGIVLGFFTATEASAIAVLYTLILGIVYNEIKMRELPRILLNSSKTSAVVLLLIASSMSMSWVISYENLPQNISHFLLGISDNKIIILLLINLILLFVGIFMDMTPATLIFTPIFLPIVKSIGIDPVQFGIIMVVNLCIGLCTPPVGSVLFVGISVAKTSVEKVVKPLLPLFLAMILSLILITLIPEITLWLPRKFGF
ncbi:MAG: hypothetical protein CMC11_06500 [Flavobacteriaceae bacterium]|nr:hypothetical protein [Flavobacteriaceae bacterium]